MQVFKTSSRKIFGPVIFKTCKQKCVRSCNFRLHTLPTYKLPVKTHLICLLDWKCLKRGLIPNENLLCVHYWKLELACHKQPASFKPSFPQTIELWPQFTPSSMNNQGERLMNKCFRVVMSQGSSFRVDSIQCTTNSLKCHCLLLSAHIVRAVEALKTTRSCLNHLELPKLSHCVSLWKTHSPLWRWIAPTSRTHHHLGPYPSPLFFCPLHSSAQNLFQAQIKQLSIHAAATTRTAVKTCFVTLRTAPDRQAVRCIQIPQV